MTNQEAFNAMVGHLREQGERATDAGGICYYRAPGGKKCAVGALIPDEKYHLSLEGQGVACLEVQAALPSGVDIRLLCAMQRTHDDIAPRNWEKGFAEVAASYELTVPPIEA